MLVLCSFFPFFFCVCFVKNLKSSSSSSSSSSSHTHRLCSSLPHKTLITHLPGGGSGVVRSFAHRKRRRRKKKKKKKRLFRKRGSTKRRDAQRRALFSCRVVFDTESSSSESPERFLIPKDSILWILIGNTNAAGVVVLVVFPRARPRCSRRRTTTTRLLLLLLPFRRKRRRRKRRR